jgi:hypothetical protein
MEQNGWCTHLNECTETRTAVLPCFWMQNFNNAFHITVFFILSAGEIVLSCLTGNANQFIRFSPKLNSIGR